MGYIALYRKYRPQTFNDIVGQENVTKILKNQIKTGKISHAYIFSGTRGTGKTSAAKVFSRAINCLNPKDGEPCNECDVCKSILSGTTTDVVEMDAASNNSVENIRQIRQEVIYATVDVKYRVYIIDEAHMLTTSAFNALLKTLEEPPSNVIFILATTESHKIPVTILSRCLRFDFDRLSQDNISSRLEYICEKENIKYEKEALNYIAKLADGALRDGISILDRCISQMDEAIKLNDVRDIVGAIDEDILDAIVENVYKSDEIKVLKSIDTIILKGKDLRYLISNLNEKFLYKLINEKDNNVKNRTVSIIDRLSKLDNELKSAINPQILLKSVMVEICECRKVTPNDKIKNSNVDLSKIDMLEKKIASLQSQINLIKCEEDNNKSDTKIEATTNNLKAKYKDENTNIKVDNMDFFKDADDFKKFVLQKGNLKIYSVIAASNIYYKEKVLAIVTINSFAYNLLSEKASIDTLENMFKEKYNKDVIVKVLLNEKHENDTLKIEKLFSQKDVNYTKMD